MRTTLTYDEALEKVIEGVKCGIPISKMLVKIKYSRDAFYKNSSPETIRYLKELKMLRVSDGTTQRMRRKDYLADFTVFE